MLRDVTIGQYFSGRSPLHRMDPRGKILLTVAYIVALFLPKTWPGLGLAAAVPLAAYLIARIPLRYIWKSLKPVLFIAAFTALINLFYNSRGTVLFQWWIFTVTDLGINTTVFIVARITLLILGSSLLTYTTTPTDLTDAIERLLTPLKWLHLNVHELAMMMTIALRFIPTLIEETDKIMSAQKARGADMESGGLIKRIRALLPVLIPLFVSSFRRAYDLSLAMECRCYRGGEGRTRMKQLKWGWRDLAAALIIVALIAGVILLNRLFPAVI